MKEKIIAILSDLRPEFDFTDESLNFIEEEACLIHLMWCVLLMPLIPNLI